MYNIKKLKYILAVLIVSFLCMNYYNVKAEELDKSNGKAIILLDPGHGGIDGGAVSKNGIHEKDINLNISKKLKVLLQKQGYTVVMTREVDEGLYSKEKARIRKKKIEDLNNRCKIKKESKCNLFISIHLNMFPQSKYYGPQVWYSNNDNSKFFANILQKNLIKDLNGDVIGKKN